MTLQQHLDTVLTRMASSEHFDIRYELRDGHHGVSGSIHGVRHLNAIGVYLDNLERAFKVLTSARHKRPTTTYRIPVYVCSIAEFLSSEHPAAIPLDEKGRAMILLPSRSPESNLAHAVGRAATEAIHEVTHVLNWVKRPPKSNNLLTSLWTWFDEGTAVFMERLLLPLNQDSARYCANWVDRPEIPLDSLAAEYESGMFLGYLARRFGPPIISEVWLQAKENEKPLAVINRLVAEREPSLAPQNEDEVPVFGDYELASYFIWDYFSDSFAPDVFTRYRHRTLCGHQTLPAGSCVPVHGDLDHLACRYYRFDLIDSVSEVEVELLSKRAPLVADLRIVNSDMSRGDGVRLSAKENEPAVGKLTVDPLKIDHLVLVVTHNRVVLDNVEFAVKVSAAK
jgi:hypothetical protein